MPDDVQRSLLDHDLMNAYRSRPAYQQNDYLGWILRARRKETRDKRIVQMLRELKTGGVYMSMPHPASAWK